VLDANGRVSEAAKDMLISMRAENATGRRAHMKWAQLFDGKGGIDAAPVSCQTVPHCSINLPHLVTQPRMS
jgi:hypothetical protein